MIWRPRRMLRGGGAGSGISSQLHSEPFFVPVRRKSTHFTTTSLCPLLRPSKSASKLHWLNWAAYINGALAFSCHLSSMSVRFFWVWLFFHVHSPKWIKVVKKTNSICGLHICNWRRLLTSTTTFWEKKTTVLEMSINVEKCHLFLTDGKLFTSTKLIRGHCERKCVCSLLCKQNIHTQ